MWVATVAPDAVPPPSRKDNRRIQTLDEWRLKPPKFAGQEGGPCPRSIWKATAIKQTTQFRLRCDRVLDVDFAGLRIFKLEAGRGSTFLTCNFT